MSEKGEGQSLSDRINAAVGTWYVEGDAYEIFKSDEGGLLATGLDGTLPISPMWVMMHGQKTPTPEPEPSSDD